MSVSVLYVCMSMCKYDVCVMSVVYVCECMYVVLV